jgi:hypothetical protein
MTQNKISFSRESGFSHLKTVGLTVLGVAVISLSLQKITNKSLSCWSPYGQLLAEVDFQHHDDGPKKANNS